MGDPCSDYYTHYERLMNQGVKFSAVIVKPSENAELLADMKAFKRSNIITWTDVQKFIPRMIGVFKVLKPLESFTPKHFASIWLGNNVASTFHVYHVENKTFHCIRVCHNFNFSSIRKCDIAVRQWRQFRERSDIAELMQFFSTNVFGDNAMCLVYAYHKDAKTLQQIFMTASHNRSQTLGEAIKGAILNKRTLVGPILNEGVIWSVVIQMVTALRAIHSVGLASRTINPTKAIWTDGRVCLSFCSLNDILKFNIRRPDFPPLDRQKKDDFNYLGRLVLAMACRHEQAFHRMNSPLSQIALRRLYSPALVSLVNYLTTSENCSFDELVPMIGDRIYSKINAISIEADQLESRRKNSMSYEGNYEILGQLNMLLFRQNFPLTMPYTTTGQILHCFYNYLMSLNSEQIAKCLHFVATRVREYIVVPRPNDSQDLQLTYAEIRETMDLTMKALVER